MLIWWSKCHSRMLLIINPFLSLAKPKHCYSISYSTIVFRFCWKRQLYLRLVSLIIALMNLMLSYVCNIIFLTKRIDWLKMSCLVASSESMSFLSTVWISVQKHRYFGFFPYSLQLIGCFYFQITLFIKSQNCWNRWTRSFPIHFLWRCSSLVLKALREDVWNIPIICLESSSGTLCTTSKPLSAPVIKLQLCSHTLLHSLLI